MNFGQVSRLLSGFTLFFTLALTLPLTLALVEEKELTTGSAFVAALVTGLALSALLWLGGRRSSADFFRKESLAVVGLAWPLAGTIAAIPFIYSGSIPGIPDALFEAISGLTTTGATVLGTGNAAIEELPRSVLLWRSILQWIGGMGVILVFIVLLPGMGVTGSRLLSSEQIGVSSDSVRPRMQEHARRLFTLYVVLTIAAACGYWATGLPPFAAVCHAFTTLATGGFSTHNASIGGYDNVGAELVAITFMFLAGSNFLLLLRRLSRSHAKPVRLLHDAEFRVYLGLTVGIALLMTASLWLWGHTIEDPTVGVTRDYSSLGRCLRDASFQTVSILTGTGYCSADYNLWPKPALFLLIACMFIGGCTGSTTGGFKVLRVVVCWKLIGYSLRQFTRPRTVEKLKLGDEVIPNRIVAAILALLLLWIGTILVGTMILGLDPRLDMTSAFAASLSMIGIVGPAMSEVAVFGGETQLVGGVDVGPYGGYGLLHPATKAFMALQMILGRLEIVAPLVLFMPSFWRR